MLDLCILPKVNAGGATMQVVLNQLMRVLAPPTLGSQIWLGRVMVPALAVSALRPAVMGRPVW